MDQKTQLIQKLQNRIRSVESGSRAGAEQTISSGCVALDRLLPANGYQRGSLVQWITGGGSGADFLSLLAAQRSLPQRWLVGRDRSSESVLPNGGISDRAATRANNHLARSSDSIFSEVSIFRHQLRHEHGISSRIARGQ